MSAWKQVMPPLKHIENDHAVQVVYESAAFLIEMMDWHAACAKWRMGLLDDLPTPPDYGSVPHDVATSIQFTAEDLRKALMKVDS